MTTDQPALPFDHGEIPLVVNCGIGVNSTALLIELERRGIRPDVNIFADIGDEKPSTYAYIDVLNEWCRSVDFPEIITVRYQVKDFKNWPPYHTLGENSLTNGTLPGLAFGKKSCSIKWKASPIKAHLKEHPLIKPILGAGGRFHQMLGYDAGPPDKRRRKVADTISDKLAFHTYPLQDWDWDRDRCKLEIAKAGLLVPDKSSCTFCPAMKPNEVKDLPASELRKIVAIEARFSPRAKIRVQGLWIQAVKGMRGATPKPGRMTDYIREHKLLTEAEIDFIWTDIPKEILRWQDAHKEGRVINEWPAFFSWLDHQCKIINEDVPLQCQRTA